MQKIHKKKLSFNKKTIIHLNQKSFNRLGGMNTPPTSYDPSAAARYSCGDPRCHGATTSKPSLESSDCNTTF